MKTTKTTTRTLRRLTPRLTGKQQRLVEENLGLVHSRGRHWAILWGADFDEVISDGWIGLVRAAMGFNPALAKFSTYAVTCIDRSIWYANSLKRRDPVNAGVPIEYSQIPSEPTAVTQDRQEEHAMAREVWQKARQILPRRDWQVLKRRMSGEKLHEIADRIGLTRERVRQIQRDALEMCRERMNTCQN